MEESSYRHLNEFLAKISNPLEIKHMQHILKITACAWMLMMTNFAAYAEQTPIAQLNLSSRNRKHIREFSLSFPTIEACIKSSIPLAVFHNIGDTTVTCTTQDGSIPYAVQCNWNSTPDHDALIAKQGKFGSDGMKFGCKKQDAFIPEK